MGNRIHVNYCKVLLLDDNGAPREHSGSPESYGYHIYDDYDDTNDSGYDTFEELQNSSFRPETIVSFLMNNTDMATEALEHGLFFNNNWIDGKALKEMQKPEEDDGK